MYNFIHGLHSLLHLVREWEIAANAMYTLPKIGKCLLKITTLGTSLDSGDECGLQR